VPQRLDRRGAQVHGGLLVLPADGQQPRAADDHRVGELEGHQPQQLGQGAERHQLEQVGDQEQQRDRQDDLGHHERQQHLEVEGAGDAAAPAVQPDRERHPQRHRHQGGEHRQPQAVQQRVVQVGSCHTDSSGSPQYQRSEKPCQLERERPALNENHTAIATGRIDQAR